MPSRVCPARVMAATIAGLPDTSGHRAVGRNQFCHHALYARAGHAYPPQRKRLYEHSCSKLRLASRPYACLATGSAGGASFSSTDTAETER